MKLTYCNLCFVLNKKYFFKCLVQFPLFKVLSDNFPSPIRAILAGNIFTEVELDKNYSVSGYGSEDS